MMERRGSRGVTSRRNATKSPTRNKSPGRKSPARKSPARKSPIRKLEPTIKEEVAVKGRPRGRPKVVPSQQKNLSPKVELQKISLSPIKHESVRSNVQTKTTTTTTSSSVKVSNITNESDEEVKRYVSKRLNQANAKLDSRYTPTPSELSRQTQSRSISRSVVDDDEYSDRETEPIHDEDRNKYNYRQETQKSTTSIWVGLSSFGLILLISLLGFYLVVTCNREECSFNVHDLAQLKSLQSYGSWEVCLAYLGFIGSILLLSPLPIGRSLVLKNEKQSTTYKFNGLGLAVIIGTAVLYGEYRTKYPVFGFIYRNYQQFCGVCIVYALIVAWLEYIANRNVPDYECNPYARSGSFWKDYFIGRQINPRWLYFDIKLIHYHAAVIATLLFNGILIQRNLRFSALPVQLSGNRLSWLEIITFTYNNVKYDQMSLVIVCLLFWHTLDLLIYEHHIASSFFLEGEGVGAFLLLRNALFPFLNTLIGKYFWEHRTSKVPEWAVVATIIIFLIGWLVQRRSNAIKYKFRTNPSDSIYGSKYRIY